MTLFELIPLFVQTGATGVLAWVFMRLHRSAVAAEKGRADDWRTAANEWRAYALERDKQLAHILSAVRTTTAADPVKDGP